MRTGWERDEEAGQRLNGLQKIQKSMGVLTLPNAMSLARPILAWHGVNHLGRGNKGKAALFLALAGLSDMDGTVARATGTDDPNIGAKADAIADAITASVVGIGAVKGNIMSLEAMLTLYGPKAANAFTAAKATIGGVEDQHTDIVDKGVEAARWGVLATYFASHILKNEVLKKSADTSAAIVGAAGILSSARQSARCKQRRQNTD